MIIDDVKTYLRIDGSEEDTFLTSLISSAKEYIKNGTGYPVNEANELHKLAVNLLVTNWYENREPIGKADKLAFSLDSIFMQLRYCYIPPNIPTGLVATISDNIIDLSWYANIESNLAGYKIYKDSVEIGTSVTNSFQVAYTAGTYQVSAYDLDGNESKLSEGVIL
jgi:uncharacterized phage protein (predicted DNA packaging)